MPNYPPEAIVKSRLYCFSCVCQVLWKSEIESHCTAEHGIENPMVGLDYGDTNQITWMLRVRDEWIELQALSFGLEMHEQFGADDFVAEAEIRSA